MLQNKAIETKELMEMAGVRDRNAFFSAVKQLGDNIETERSPGKRSSYHLSAHFIRFDVIDNIDIDKKVSVTHLSYLSMCNTDAKPSIPPTPEQLPPDPKPILPTLTHTVEPYGLNHTSMPKPYGLNHTSTVEPYTSDLTHAVEPYITRTSEGYTFESEEESLLGRIIAADEMQDIHEHGKRSPRRKMQLALIAEAWAEFFPYTTPLGESSALKFLRMTGEYSEDVYNAFEQASRFHPESPVSYVEKVIAGIKAKQANAPKPLPSVANDDREREEEYARKQAKVDQLTEEEVMTPWQRKYRAASR